MRRWTEPLKARAARYALERSLGPFLEERLRLEQLSLDLRGGTGCLRCLRLCAPAVDELLAAAGAPLELREGVLDSVTVTVPWAALGSRSCGLRVTGLRLALRPRQRGGPGAAPPRSGRRDPPPEPPPLEGLEALALTIDGVLRRLRVELEDTELRVELPGGALELRLPRVEYEDEGGPGPAPPPVLLKGLRFGDLRLLWQELPPPGALEAAPPPPVPVGLSPGPSRLSLRLKQNQALPGPAVEVQGEVGALHLLLPPPLLEALWGLLGTFDPPDPGPPPAGRSRPLGPQDLELIERELSRCLRGGDPPDPPGDPPGAELFYSMTGSLGGQSPAPPEATPPPSPTPSAAGSPRFQPPSPHCSPASGQGPPRPGGCRVRVTLGTVMLALPQPGCAPPRGDEQLLWGALCGGHALPIPHFRLQAGGAQGGLELGTAGGPRGHLGVARMELTEELPGAEPHRLQVLRFPPGSPPAQPCLRLRYGPPTPPGPGEPPLKEPPPPRELSLELGPMESDLDLGLIERFGPALAGLGHAPGTETPPGEEWAWPRVRWAAPRAVLRLRLPRVDLRPPPLRGPPPNLRPESLRLELGGPRGAGGARGGALVCSRLLVVYEAEDMGTIPCLCVEPGPGPGGTRCLPTLEVTVPEPPSGAPPGPPLSPFSAQRSIYESHELVLPGTPQELGAFVGGALGGAPCSLRLTLPRAHLSLRPPALLQRLYSRINELLLWEPAGHAPFEGHAPFDDHAPSGAPAPSGSHAPSSGSAPPSSDTFKPCKSAPGTDSEEEEEEDDDEGPAVPPGAMAAAPPQSSAVVLITVPWGRVTADCHPTEGSPGSRLVLEVGEGRLCLVPAPGGRRGGAGACAEVMELRLWHGPIPEEGGEELEVPSGEGPPPPLQLVIGPWEEPGPPPEAPPDPRMLVLALESELSPPGDTRELVVSVALQGALLQHRPAPPAQHWFSQLLALLALDEEEVLGYPAPTPLTRLHLHLRRCGLHYRPPPLPLRVLVTAETLSVTSSSTPDTSTFLLRLLVDDGAVLLSDRWGEPKLELQRDFICVLDVDFLELVLSSWKGNGEGQSPPCPRDELRLAPARLRARTCPDSAAAIARLLQHLSSPTARPTPGPTPGPAPAHGDTQVPPCAPHGPPTAAINQQDLTDALRDAPRLPHGAPRPPDEAPPPPPPPPVSMYLFPGEGGPRPHGCPIAAVPAPPAPPPAPPGGSGSPDADGFCILEAPPSPAAEGAPCLRWLAPGPLRLIEGHFGPGGGSGGSRDRLRPPPGLPPPRERLLLRDTSLRWQLFGGRDFGPGPAPAARPRRGGHAPSGHSHWRSRGGPGRRQDLLMELHLGKVSVQHETYDEKAAEAQPWGSHGAAVGPGERPTARLVLLVQDLELRDRLGGDGAPPFLSRHPRGAPPPQPPTLWVKALRVLPHPPPPGGVPECCLRVALAPLRLHIDQDALLFLRDYISSFIAHMDPPAPPPHGSGAPQGLEEEEPETENPVYFREFRFTAEVPVWLDYHGKRVTMEQGALAGILIGLAQLNCCHLRLRRLCHRHGLLGLSRVLSFAVAEWLRDIRCHQLPGLLGGVAPVHAVLRLWRALRELLLLGTPPGGVTRGVTALGAASASAALSLCSRLLRALQALAEALYELVAPPGPPRALEAPPEASGDHQQPPPSRRARPRPQ